MERLTVTTQLVGAGRVVMTLTGELDLAAHDALSEQITTYLRAGALLVIDTLGVTFCDSCGLQVLALARHTAQEVGAILRLVGPGEATQYVLELAGMGDLFDIYPGPAAALAKPAELRAVTDGGAHHDAD